MSNLWIEALVIVGLIFANGFFSAAEIAMVTMRRSRLNKLITEGRRGAQTVAAMKDDPAHFLATVQVGVTVLGATASALGGASAVALLEPMLQSLPIPYFRPWAGLLAFVLIVGTISYLTLVIGELVPKSLGLRYTEGLACFSAPIIHRLSRISLPVIRVLTWSTNLVLRLFGGETARTEALFSEEEVKHIIHEGAHQGIFDEAERQLIHSVFEFTDTSVREVMVPRADIHAVALETPPATVLETILETGFSRAPVYQQDLDHIVGIVHVKDLLRSLHKETPSPLAAVMHPAFFVPDSMQISDLLRDLQNRRSHMAIVLNEFGTVIGLVSIEDLLEEIVGEIRDEFDIDEELPIQVLPDGSFLVDGSVPLTDLHEKHGLPIEETQDYRTIAGFLLARLKRIPKGGEAITHEGWRMTIVTIDGRRLRKVRIERPPAVPPPAA